MSRDAKGSAASKQTKEDNLSPNNSSESADPPPLRLLGAPPRAAAALRLPIELSSFVGRGRELAEVETLLGATRLLTITGPGGYSKTRLALRVATDLAPGFSCGAFFVGLASLADPDLIPQAVAQVLGVRETPNLSLLEAIEERLGLDEALLLMDNCEHLVEGCAGLADALLRSCPNLKILATSREVLGVSGEVVWAAPPLSVPDDHHAPAPEALLRHDAAKLFVERARSVAPAFALTEQNAPALARVCRRLDGMPLAIELAAARTKVLSVSQIAERLDDRFRLLASDSRTALPRHKTLRATMDWSHELLAEDERVLFRRLSVFAGGFALEAAEQVCAGEGIEREEVLDLLSHLVDKSLVVVEERGDEARYRLLETVRQYGQEKLDESTEEAAATKRRHALFFLKLAEEAEPNLLGPQQDAWMGRLDMEHHNLRAAMGWFEECGDAERGLRSAGALRRFWWSRAYYREGRTWLEGFLELAGASERTPERAKALHALGVLIHRHADYPAGDHILARSRLEESVETYRQLGDGPRTAAVLWDLGRLSNETGDWETAHSSLEESAELERQAGNECGVALARSSLGFTALLRGEHELARAHVEESLRVLRRLGSPEEAKRCLFFLGHLACDEGDYAAARARFAEMIQDADLERNTWTAPFLLMGYAHLAAGEGQAGRALRLAGAADALQHTVGTSMGPAYQAYLRRDLDRAWQALDEEEGAAAWAEGRSMTLEEALTYALDETSLAALPCEATQTEIGAFPELRIFALGPARVERGEHTLTPADWAYAKPKELLFYLLSHPSRSRGQIGLVFWPDASPSRLKSTFHVTLHHLRRALGAPKWVVFEKGRYHFNRSLGYFFDVEAFEKGLDEARRAEGEAQAISYLQEALALYRGDFLEDLADAEWVVDRREELRRRYQEALVDLGGLLFEEGRYAEAADAYRRTIAHDPYSEAAHRELMRCYVRQGERNQALRHYQTLVELLRDELGSSPAPETAEVHRRLLRGEDL